MRPVSLRVSTLALVCLASAVALAACLSPTEVVLDVRTDVACASASQWRGVAVSVGAPGVDVETRAPVLTTTACSATGEIGSLVVVPTGAKDAQIGLRVVAGITRDPETCAAANYDGCIVSRRTLSYLPHQSQTVVVDLATDCIGNACDENHTCVNGSCVDAVTAAPPLAPDGGVASGPLVLCGDDGTMCPANDDNLVCCVTFDLDPNNVSGKGSCVAPHDCPSTSAALSCDDSSDCPEADGGEPGVCCYNVGRGSTLVTSVCTAYSTCSAAGEDALCEDRHVCPVSGALCNDLGVRGPGYFGCNPTP